MTGPAARTGRSEVSTLAVFLGLQVAAAVFFVGDVAADLADGADRGHLVFEALVTAGLVAGIAFGLVALRRTIETLRAQD